MNWEAVSAISEVVGAIAVIATLFYLAFEIRHNSAVIRARSSWDAQVSFASINEIIAQGGEIGEASFKLFSDPDGLTSYEAYLNHRLIRATLQKLEAQYALYKQGILDPEVWHNRRTFGLSLITSGVGAKVWELEKQNSMLTEPFIKEIETATPIDLGGMLGTTQ